MNLGTDIKWEVNEYYGRLCAYDIGDVEAAYFQSYYDGMSFYFSTKDGEIEVRLQKPHAMANNYLFPIYSKDIEWLKNGGRFNKDEHILKQVDEDIKRAFSWLPKPLNDSWKESKDDILEYDETGKPVCLNFEATISDERVYVAIALVAWFTKGTKLPEGPFPKDYNFLQGREREYYREAAKDMREYLLKHYSWFEWLGNLKYVDINEEYRASERCKIYFPTWDEAKRFSYQTGIGHILGSKTRKQE